MNPFDNKLFVINKVSGPTSFDVVMQFRRATGLRKVGHTGTLDPLAHGLLLICTGRATRAVEHFMELEKTYDFEVLLGIETSTLDREGEVIAEAPVPDIPREVIEKAAADFIGDYELTPPKFSAVKMGGERLYEAARRGEDPIVPTRQVHIHSFEILSVDLPRVSCRVRCSRGTYVRSLAKDLGAALGLPAHIVELSRTHVGPFSLEDAFPSEELDGDVGGRLQSHDLEEALSFMPGIVLNSRSKRALMYGILPGDQDVVRTIGHLVEDRPIRILDEAGSLLAVGKRGEGEDRNLLTLVDSYRLFVDAESL